MSPKWFIGLLLLFLACSVFSGIIEMAYIDAGDTAVFERLLYIDTLQVQGSYNGATNFILGVFTNPMQFLSALWQVFTFDYAMFHGSYAFARYLLLAVSAGIVVSLVLVIFRGVSSAS